LVEVGNNSGYGFDPSYLGPSEYFSGQLKYIKEFYDTKHSSLVADFVVCRHVIEHIPEPVSMLSSILHAMVNSRSAKVFFETPDIEWILKNQVVWDFFYEHCSYFSQQSIQTAFEKAGFSVDHVNPIFGDQYLWIQAAPSPKNLPSEANVERLIELTNEFGYANALLAERWAQNLKELQKQGPVALWGAGAKGVTFANLFDPDQKNITCIIDVNPNKQEKYLPGTGHRIISPQHLSKYQLKTVILMNPNYRQEIEKQIREETIETIHLMEFSTRTSI
jgi:hypothetical protein